MEEHKYSPFQRPEWVQSLERFATGLAGYAIIAVLIAVPGFLAIFLVYFLFFH